jgi:hypothetical protein
MSDPIDDAARALQTTVGTSETELRGQLGNEGYELYMERFNGIEDLRVVSASHHAEQVRQWAAIAAAKAGFWRSVAGAVSVAALLGVGWSVWEWLR